MEAAAVGSGIESDFVLRLSLLVCMQGFLGAACTGSLTHRRPPAPHAAVHLQVCYVGSACAHAPTSRPAARGGTTPHSTTITPAPAKTRRAGPEGKWHRAARRDFVSEFVPAPRVRGARWHGYLRQQRLRRRRPAAARGHVGCYCPQRQRAAPPTVTATGAATGAGSPILPPAPSAAPVS